MQKEAIKKLKSIHSDLCDSAAENELDLFESAVERLDELIKQLSAQEHANSSDGDGVAVLEGVKYNIKYAPIGNVVWFTRRS